MDKSTLYDAISKMDYSELEDTFAFVRRQRSVRTEYINSVKESLQTHKSVFWVRLVVGLMGLAILGKLFIDSLSVDENSYWVDIVINVTLILLTAFVIDRRFDRIHENDQLEQLLRLMSSRLNNQALWAAAELKSRGWLRNLKDRVNRCKGFDLDEANLAHANLGFDTHFGIEDYNSNPDECFNDMSGISFRNANLYGAFLHRVNLKGCDLRGANLCKANLAHAILDGADLRGADLYWANLTFAKVEGATIDNRTRLPDGSYYAFEPTTKGYGNLIEASGKHARSLKELHEYLQNYARDKAPNKHLEVDNASSEVKAAIAACVPPPFENLQRFTEQLQAQGTAESVPYYTRRYLDLSAYSRSQCVASPEDALRPAYLDWKKIDQQWDMHIDFLANPNKAPQKAEDSNWH